MTASVRHLSMVQVDVFTDRPLTGNSLAVFLDGRGLSTEQMQALALEMNLSETTFVLPGMPQRPTPAACVCASSPYRKNCPSPDIPRWARLSFCAVRPERRDRAGSQRRKRAGALFARTRKTRLWRDDAEESEFGAIHNAADVARLTA